MQFNENEHYYLWKILKLFENLQADEQGNLTWEEDHLDIIRKWATAAESLIHGRASGLDAAVCTFGMFIL